MFEARHKARRGFAWLDPEKLKPIASKGGHSVPAEKRPFSTTRDLATAAGRKGGVNVPAGERAFAKNRELASAAGKARAAGVRPGNEGAA